MIRCSGEMSDVQEVAKGGPNCTCELQAVVTCYGRWHTKALNPTSEQSLRVVCGGGRGEWYRLCTVRKMSLILCSIERMLKMQFSMASKFTLQPLRRYDVKPPKNRRKRNLPFDMPSLELTK